ncbi:MAG TPA: hypothetical protein VK666_24020 [Chryseolinea sp.]|nr:hypothetical protein [Chryseolinea sp.]
MGVKIFKAVWFLSMLAALADLLVTYASLPATVVIYDDGIAPYALSRDNFFYMMTALMAVVNAMVFIATKVFKNDVDFRTWFFGLVITLNIFFIITLNFVGLFNSGERFDYQRIDFIIYGSIGLFLVWAAGWPFYSLYKRLFIKQSA